MLPPWPGTVVERLPNLAAATGRVAGRCRPIPAGPFWPIRGKPAVGLVQGRGFFLLRAAEKNKNELEAVCEKGFTECV